MRQRSMTNRYYNESNYKLKSKNHHTSVRMPFLLTNLLILYQR